MENLIKKIIVHQRKSEPLETKCAKSLYNIVLGFSGGCLEFFCFFICSIGPCFPCGWAQASSERNWLNWQLVTEPVQGLVHCLLGSNWLFPVPVWPVYKTLLLVLDFSSISAFLFCYQMYEADPDLSRGLFHEDASKS